jgi:hypothetical protein
MFIYYIHNWRGTKCYYVCVCVCVCVLFFVFQFLLHQYSWVGWLGWVGSSLLKAKPPPLIFVTPVLIYF